VDAATDGPSADTMSTTIRGTRRVWLRDRRAFVAFVRAAGYVVPSFTGGYGIRHADIDVPVLALARAAINKGDDRATIALLRGSREKLARRFRLR
jgi:hypothetical protein